MNMDLAATLETTLDGLGYELVDWEWGGGGLLRVFIDSPQGITVEDCALVSNQLSRLFAVEDLDYDRLEISSPGLDRPLKKVSDYQRFVGSEVQIKLRMALNGQRRFAGVIKNASDTEVVLDIGGELKSFAFNNIDKAKLKPEI
jgi:ribosome maturation factor RimP